MIKKKYLMTPGPTPVPEDILSLAARPLSHHRTPEFSASFREMTENLRYVFSTRQDVYCLAASGSGAMEAAVANLTAPGDHVLVINAGKFGERWADIARSWGGKVTEEKIAWGADFPRGRLEEALARNPGVRVVFSTLSETSSGALYDVAGFARTCRRADILLAVDAISGLGTVPCPMDEWEIDAMIGASQKSLMAPPGLSYIALGPRAWAKAEANPSPRFYFDLRRYRKSLADDTTPFSPAISLVTQQCESLRRIRSLTLEGLIAHHALLAEATRAGVKALGLELLAEKPGNALTAVKVPPGVDGKRLVKELQYSYMIHVASAQAPHQGEFFRIGHLGYIGAFDLIALFAALDMALPKLGAAVVPGASVAAAESVLQEKWK